MGDGLGPRVLVPKSVARIEPVRIRMPVGLAWRWIHGAMGQVNTELSCRCVTPDPVSSQRGDWTGKRIDNLQVAVDPPVLLDFLEVVVRWRKQGCAASCPSLDLSGFADARLNLRVLGNPVYVLIPHKIVTVG